jgi:hypothetical protein
VHSGSQEVDAVGRQKLSGIGIGNLGCDLAGGKNHGEDWFALAGPVVAEGATMRIRWSQFIDGYDWKARLIPTAILLFPVSCTIYYFFPGVLSNPLQLAGSSILAFAFVYLASMFFRDRGVRYAKQFWEERGGLPSTRFGRIRDSYLSADQKNRIQLAVLHRFGIRLMSLEEECEYPALADRRIMDAFR